MGELVQHAIFVESGHMAQIQEGHFLIQHMVAYYFLQSDQNNRGDESESPERTEPESARPCVTQPFSRFIAGLTPS